MEALHCYASKRSKGKQIQVGSATYTVEEARPAIFKNLDLAFFAAGGSITRKLAPEAIRRGCLVIDNSSAFRQEKGVPLVIPEINPGAAHRHQGLIANPNCSIAITLMGLYPLHKAFGLKRVICSTYQAVSGAGIEAMQELEEQVHAWAEGREAAPPQAIPNHSIAFNLVPQVDTFGDDGYTGEETKMRNEARKILDLPDLPLSATCVRVPVLRAHSIAVHAEFERKVSVREAREAIAFFEGAVLCDDPENRVYPTPLQFTEKVQSGVGRIRKDSVFENGLAFFVSGDQLWKGAALNAIQIAESLDMADLLKVPARAMKKAAKKQAPAKKNALRAKDPEKRAPKKAAAKKRSSKKK